MVNPAGLSALHRQSMISNYNLIVEMTKSARVLVAAPDAGIPFVPLSPVACRFRMPAVAKKDLLADGFAVLGCLLIRSPTAVLGVRGNCNYEAVWYDGGDICNPTPSKPNCPSRTTWKLAQQRSKLCWILKASIWRLKVQAVPTSSGTYSD